MSKKHRKSYNREFKIEAVRLFTDKKYSIAEASRNLGVEYSVLRRWKQQLADDPLNAFPGKGQGNRGVSSNRVKNQNNVYGAHTFRYVFSRLRNNLELP